MRRTPFFGCVRHERTDILSLLGPTASWAKGDRRRWPESSRATRSSISRKNLVGTAPTLPFLISAELRRSFGSRECIKNSSDRDHGRRTIAVFS